MLAEIAGLPEGDGRRERVRTEIVRMHLPYIRAIVRRYSHRGEPVEDIMQAGMVGLIKALNRFDPLLGDRFIAYASVTISGEIKRHFRDTTWTVRVSRRIQELRITLRRMTAEFTVAFGRAPTVEECAILLDATEEEIIDVLHSSGAYSPLSLDASPGDDDAAPSLGDALGYDEEQIAHIVDMETLRPLIDDLPERERAVLTLRFWGNRTQSQIAAEIGVSQMHVSRVLSRTLADLRTAMTSDAAPLSSDVPAHAGPRREHPRKPAPNDGFKDLLRWAGTG